MILTQELVQRLFRYEDGKLFWKERYNNFSRVVIGDEAGSHHNKGYRHIGIGNARFLTHRIIYLHQYGILPKEIDHIDNNRMNNKIENLRECTRQENMFNRKINENNASGIKGINWKKDIGKWAARIQVDENRIFLGAFKILSEAKEAVENARIKYHGNFARNE